MPTREEIVEQALRHDGELPPTQRTAARVQGLETAVRALLKPATGKLGVRLLHPAAVAPSACGSGFELRACEGAVVAARSSAVISTGVALVLPPGIAGLLLPRCGPAAVPAVTLAGAPGLIDPDQGGELAVALRNDGPRPFAVEAGDRVARLLLLPCWAPAVEVVHGERP